MRRTPSAAELESLVYTPDAVDPFDPHDPDADPAPMSIREWLAGHAGRGVAIARAVVALCALGMATLCVGSLAGWWRAGPALTWAVGVTAAASVVVDQVAAAVLVRLRGGSR